MRKNTHTEFMSFTDKDGNVTNAFVSGVPDKCQHDDDGEQLWFNDEGQYFKHSEIPDYDKDPEACVAFLDKHKLNGSCVSCSKCGKPFELDIHNMP